MGLAARVLRHPLPITARDARILTRASAKYRGNGHDLARALCEAVEELIPNGRVYLLAPGPILGSLISGIGVTPSLTVVRVHDGNVETLGEL